MRRRVFGLLRSVVVAASVFVASGAVSADEPPAGFTALFNGKDLAGCYGMNPHSVANLKSDE